ncbi:plastid-lipid associated protein pap, partial [Nannochloropsis gaditana CCMP526]|uniref:plastid-lipid associated protein pap n=1 Tax=Nannochloropsis gaditana (strain CCMP526) TaxID=1093141 RepID=UPI00029F55C8
KNVLQRGRGGCRSSRTTILAQFLFIVCILTATASGYAFSTFLPLSHSTSENHASTTPRMLLSGFFPAGTTGSRKDSTQIKKLKKTLFETMEGSDRGRVNLGGGRERTIQAIQALAAVNPTPNSATSPLASGTWDLVWTTEEPSGPRVYFTWEDARVIYKGFVLPFPSFFFVKNAYYDNIYLDSEIRCVRDIRGNYLVVRRV